MSKFEELVRNFVCAWCWAEFKQQPAKAARPEGPPLIFVMGPACSGKTTVGQKLAKTIGYAFAEAAPEHPAEALYAYIEATKADAVGFVIAGFPNTIDEAKRFETDYYKPKALVYCSIPLDVYVRRNVEKHPGTTEASLKNNYVDEHTMFQKLYRLHETRTVKMLTHVETVDHNNNELVKDLEMYWGFKFDPTQKHT